MTLQHPEVVRLITRLNIGGPARQALLLTNELKDRWPTLLAAGSPRPDEGELTDPAVAVHRVPLVRPVRPAMDVRAYAEIRRLLRRHEPRVLHTHMAKAGLVGRVACLRSGIRTVHTYHGHVLSGYFTKPIQRTFLELERRLARITDVLVAISPEIRDALLDLGVGTPRQYEVIPLGFDLSEHLAVERPSGRLRNHLGVAADVPLVGTIARLVPIKDLRTFLRAVSFLPNVHAAILGDGEERKALEEFARHLGIRERTYFTGWWRDIPAAMSDLDVVALTSTNEGTPVSLIEALACGRPVVATDVGGVRFVIEDDGMGSVVAAGDAEAVAHAIRSFLDSPLKSDALRARARARVRERFHKDRLVADIDAVYSDLVPARVSTPQP